MTTQKPLFIADVSRVYQHKPVDELEAALLE